MSEKTKENHTPGPWKLSGFWQLIASNGKLITFQKIVSCTNDLEIAAVMTDAQGKVSLAEMEANTMLIKAAPELFQAAVMALVLLEDAVEGNRIDSCLKSVSCTIDFLKEAIMSSKKMD